MPPPAADNWIASVERACERFANKHAITYRKSEREISASFEIGCFHALIEFYETSCEVTPENLTSEGNYRYLTTPSGNPANFSYVTMTTGRHVFTLRQQVRIRSYLDPDISFTPDMVVLAESAKIDAKKDKDYASGKRSFFCVSSSQVVAAHECKSMNPFPELLVSFIGHLMAAHDWLQQDTSGVIELTGTHLAPTLFVGGTARGLHVRMIRALEKCYPLNICVGMHEGSWRLTGRTKLVRLSIDFLSPRKQRPVRRLRLE